MTNYPQYPAGSSPEPPMNQGPIGPRPSSIDMAVKLIWVAVALTVLSTLLSFLYLDDAVDSALDNDTTGTLTEDAARTAVIVVTVLILAIGVGLYAMLAFFIGKGKNWARIVYTVLAALFLLLGILGLGGDQPAVSMLLGVIQVVVTVATLFFLWKRESTDWLTGRPAAA
ncbi:hypothetical protein [Nocardioides sp.]|uniref:hypothetical protein n=1 Tax=Nocardioides sp. TaxID=35761 RepID=UPI002ED31CD1